MDNNENFNAILDAINRVPDQLQMFVDSIVSMQKEWPMPKAGWEAFVRSLEYTNKKHELNLHIKPELLRGNSISSQEALEMSDDEWAEFLKTGNDEK